MKRVFTIIGLISLLACAAWAYTKIQSRDLTGRTDQFNADVDDIFYSLQRYKDVVGSYPVGNNAEVVKALMGNNPKNMIIIVGRKKNVNSKGELVDPWGTPYRIYFAGEGIFIRSAGPNKRFDDTVVPNSDEFKHSDDLTRSN